MTEGRGTRRIVVGYTATDEGRDAIGLAARLAVATGAALEIVLVLPGEPGGEARSVITPPDSSYDRLVRERAGAWLEEAAAALPAGVARRAHVRWAPSTATGLVDAAHEFDAWLVVVGAAAGGGLGRHRLGSVAADLLHFADVPVALAPARRTDDGEPATLSRVTAALGGRPGADALLSFAVGLASDADAPLRLLSLVAADLPPTLDTAAVLVAGAAHADDVLERARARLDDGTVAEAVVGRGADIAEAVRGLDWHPDELVVVGSSRLAQPRRVFLGSTAGKMLRELTVPVVVVPAGPAAEARA